MKAILSMSCKECEKLLPELFQRCNEMYDLVDSDACMSAVQTYMEEKLNEDRK